MKFLVFSFVFLLTSSVFAEATPWSQIDSSKFGSLPSQLQTVIDQDRSYFFLMSFPPKKGLDFRTAEKLKSSLAASGWSKADIGHNMVAWSCKGSDGKWHRAATGFTGENSSQSKDMIKGGWGLTTFISVFTDGYLTPTSMAEDIINRKQNDSPMRYIGVEISARQCDAVVSFVKRFAKSKGATQFGLSGDVNKMEGGGCGSFVTAVMNQTGLFNKATQYFWKKFSLPNRLLGRGDSVPVDTRVPTGVFKSVDKEISFPRLLNSTWMMTISDKSSYSLTIVDPMMILFMIKGVQEANYSVLDGRAVSILKKQNTVKVKRLEAEMYAERPDQKKVLSETVSTNFDYRTKGLSPIAKSIGASLSKQGLLPRVEYVDSSLGLIFER